MPNLLHFAEIKIVLIAGLGSVSATPCSPHGDRCEAAYRTWC